MSRAPASIGPPRTTTDVTRWHSPDCSGPPWVQHHGTSDRPQPRPVHPRPDGDRASHRAGRMAAAGARAPAALAADRLHRPRRRDLLPAAGDARPAADDLSRDHRALLRVRGHHRADGRRAEARPGLQLSRDWGITWRLIAVTMPLSIAAITLIAGWWMGLSWTVALLLGAALAPTDPVLAADVQVGPPKSGEEDEVRFGLTSEAGHERRLRLSLRASRHRARAGGIDGRAVVHRMAHLQRPVGDRRRRRGRLADRPRLRLADLPRAGEDQARQDRRRPHRARRRPSSPTA